MLQPRLRFGEFGEEWKSKILSNIAKVTMGQSPDSKNYTKNKNYNILIQGNADLNDGHVVPRIYTKQITKTVNYEDIILTVRAPVGELAINQFNKAVIGRGVAGISKNKFIFYYLHFLNMSKYWDRLSSGSTFESINSNDIKTLTISEPIIKEQQKIGIFFIHLDNLIQLQQAKLDHLKRLKKGYLQKLFPNRDSKTSAMRFKGFEDEWNLTSMGKTFDIVTDYVSNGSFKNLRENVKSYSSENYSYMIRLQDASNGWKGPWLYTDKKGYEFLSKSKLYENDIIMSNVGSVGKFFKVPKLNKPMTLAPNSVLLRSNNNDNEFLYWLLQTSYAKNKVISMATPGVQHKINKTDFKTIEFLIPHLEEQKRISKFFAQLESLIKSANDKLTHLNETKTAYLQKMFI